MKHLLSIFLLLTTIVIVTGCKKSSNGGSERSSDQIVTEPLKPLSAAFKINNSTEHGLLEANYLDFNNLSQNAISYFWDFGDGTVSTDKVPSNFYYGACGANYTIRLTVKNAAGKAVTFSECYHIICTRGGVPHSPLPPTKSK